MSLRSLDGFEAAARIDDDGDETTFDVRRYIAAFLRFKWAILVLVIATGIGAWLFANTLTLYYRADARLLITPPQANLVSIQELYRVDERVPLQTEIEIIRSRAVAEEVVDRLALFDDADFIGIYQRPLLDPGRWVPSLAEPIAGRIEADQAREIAIGRVRGGLSVYATPRTRLLNVTFESPLRERAVEIVNAVGDAYIDLGLESRAESTARAANWLAERLDVLRSNLRQSEALLQEYREAQGLAEVSAATGDASVVRVAASDLEQFRARLREREEEVQRLESALNLLRDSPREQWMAQSVIVENESLGPLLAERVASQRRISELAQVYGRKHPRMVQARAEFAEIEAFIDDRVASVLATMTAEVENLSAEAASLRAQIESQRTRVQSMQRQQFDLTKLQRDVETDQRLYDLFLERIKETEQSGFDEPTARVIEASRGAYGPVRPDKNRIIGTWMFMAFVFAAGLVVLREFLDNTFKSPEDLTGALDLPSLGMLPEAVSEADRGDVGLLFDSEDRGQFAESVRTLRTSVVLSGIDRAHQIICVTSAVPGEGKTTVSTNLALALSKLERVLLIDSDMRRPSIAREFDIPASSGGVSSVIAGESKPEQCIFKHRSGLDVMAAGIVPPNPLELISSKRFRALLDALRKRYDRIVIDTAPVHAVSDALVMSTLVDTVVFVVKADATPRPLVQTSIKRLRQVQAPLAGAVLNRVRLDRKGGYKTYYGYYGHYGYYEYSEDGEGERTSTERVRSVAGSA